MIRSLACRARLLLLPTVLLLASACATTSAPPAAAAPPSQTKPAKPKPSTPKPASERIWRPALNTSWQWQLTDLPLDQSVSVAMYDVDLFDTDAATVADLKARGHRVVCYVSAGSFEDWRPDAHRFPAAIKGKPLDGWPGERWLDIRDKATLRAIMLNRIDLCKTKGFDGIEFDNVDGYANRTGFRLSYQDQLQYNRWLASSAHLRGLSAGLKNDLAQVQDLVTHFDWALNEQCFVYDECELLLPFVEAGKPVFHVEYELHTSQFCARANAMGFNSMRKNADLDAYREPCR